MTKRIVNTFPHKAPLRLGAIAVLAITCIWFLYFAIDHRAAGVDGSPPSRTPRFTFNIGYANDAGAGEKSSVYWIPIISALAGLGGNQGAQVMSQIQGGFDFFNYGHGLLGGGASVASDRFWYCGCFFDSENNAYAFSTADLTAVKNQTKNGFNTAPSLKNSYWAINKSGSIRYPLLAVDQDGQYFARANIDNTYGIRRLAERRLHQIVR